MYSVYRVHMSNCHKILKKLTTKEEDKDWHWKAKVKGCETFIVNIPIRRLERFRLNKTSNR